MKNNCVFCAIAEGEIPSFKVYEDDLVLAFLDLFPINFGHVLVIPKEHHTSAATIPEATAGRMFYVGARIGAALRHGLDAGHRNVDSPVRVLVLLAGSCHAFALRGKA